MPLPVPAPRRHRHTRRIETQGFQREDGLWDIEARIVDTKAFAYREFHRGEMPAGRPVHDMSIRLTLDSTMLVREVAAVTDAAPYVTCHEVAPRFERLVGLRIGPGWRREVRRQLGGTNGCTHMVELIDVMATVAFQTVSTNQPREDADPATLWSGLKEKPFFLNGCHSWRTDGEIVRELVPQFYKPEGEETPREPARAGKAKAG